MENINKKTKILIAVISLIIILGGIVVAIKGFNFDLGFAQMKKVEFYIKKEFNEDDIKQITSEVLGNQKVSIQKVEIYGDTLGILAEEITEEQKEQLVQKINEKYELEIKAEDVQIQNVPHAKGKDILKPYILPFSISTVIILIYMAVRYNKLGVMKTVLKLIGSVVASQAVLFSLFAICRIPVGILTIPMVIVVYLFVLLGITYTFEKELEEKNAEK